MNKDGFMIANQVCFNPNKYLLFRLMLKLLESKPV